MLNLPLQKQPFPLKGSEATLRCKERPSEARVAFRQRIKNGLRKRSVA